MNYVVPGEVLARLLVVAGARLDSDEIGDLVHRIRPERQVDVLNSEPEPDAEPIPPAKPE